jgi:hypothetical protein
MSDPATTEMVDFSLVNSTTYPWALGLWTLDVQSPPMLLRKKFTTSRGIMFAEATYVSLVTNPLWPHGGDSKQLCCLYRSDLVEILRAPGKVGTSLRSAWFIRTYSFDEVPQPNAQSEPTQAINTRIGPTKRTFAVQRG